VVFPIRFWTGRISFKRFAVLLAFLPALVAARLTLSAVEASTHSDATPFLYTAATHYDPLAWGRGEDRFTGDVKLVLYRPGGKHPLVPAFAASADPAVSFDGQRVLFAGKLKPHDPWQIWEVALNAGEPRRITSGPEDCVRPFYLPGDRIVYARKVAGYFVIETLDLSGGKPMAVTYSPANFLPTDVLHDGRILFTAAYPVGNEIASELYTVYSDGSGVESYRCDHGALRHSGRQVRSGDIVFASGHDLARFTSARATEISISAPGGEYAGEIAETPSGDWLLSWRPDANASLQLMFWTPGSNPLRPALAEPGSDLVQPTLIATATLPNRHPSGLHDWPHANLLCLNAYTSKHSFALGSIHSVRLYTRSADGNPKQLGTAPVEPDGSFFLQVPTEQPLQIELLDSAGKTLQREENFFWMRHGEQRACVGCHAGPETSPENAVPMVLLKSTTPADMTGAGPRARSAGGH